MIRGNRFASTVFLLLFALLIVPVGGAQSAAPNSAAAKAYSAGMAAIRAGDMATAESELTKAEKLDPGNADTQLALGKLLLHQGDLAGSTSHLEKAMKLKPSLAQAHFYLGQILSLEGEWSESIAQLEEAKKLAPKDADPHRALARAFSQQGRSAEALAEARAAVALVPKSPEAHDVEEVRRSIEHRRIVEIGRITQALKFSERVR